MAEPTLFPESGYRRLRIDLAYDGTEFFGWARQPDRRSVQEIIEEVLSRILKCDANVVVAGRTDAGVHASAQVIHVDIPESSFVELSYKDLIYKLNRILDEYIRIAQDGLDAMAKATPQPSPAVNSELVEALFDDRLGVTGYEWLRAMKSTAEAAKDTEYAKKDIDAYYLMLRECEAVFKVMDKAAAALKAAGEGS